VKTSTNLRFSSMSEAPSIINGAVTENTSFHVVIYSVDTKSTARGTSYLKFKDDLFAPVREHL